MEVVNTTADPGEDAFWGNDDGPSRSKKRLSLLLPSGDGDDSLLVIEANLG